MGNENSNFVFSDSRNRRLSDQFKYGENARWSSGKGSFIGVDTTASLLDAENQKSIQGKTTSAVNSGLGNEQNTSIELENSAKSTTATSELKQGRSSNNFSSSKSTGSVSRSDSGNSWQRRDLTCETSSNSVYDPLDTEVESLDFQGIEWEGYIEKKGHLVRNWKSRFCTLEGNLLSYYENKEDARKRRHLKGRVTITEVKIDNRIKNAHGHDFVFETKEGKHFHCSAMTDIDRIVWVRMLEAGIDLDAMRKGSAVGVYGNHSWKPAVSMDAASVYSMYRQVLEGNLELAPKFLWCFNKDVVMSSYYPRKLTFQGDFFGREGLLYYLGARIACSELLKFEIIDIQIKEDQRVATIFGKEVIKCKTNKLEISQTWTHQVRYGPDGRIVRLKIEINPKIAVGNWGAFECNNPYTEACLFGVRGTRALSISLHDFTVYHVIGKGGFGTVVNAKKKSDGRIYALKILEKGKMTKYDIESSFTEMSVAQNVHHPFIAGLRLAFQSQTKLFLGMNYYAGGDLFHHMSKGATCRIAPARARFYAAELILGIHHLHQHNILYRDIKPENVMIDQDGHIALVDFGLAKLYVSDYKGAKTMAGSPQYTAPELLLPKGKRSYGKAADWWSLGILLYEMTVGKSPFYDSNIEKMYQRIQNEAVSFPNKISLSDSLKDILLGLLRKDATARYGNNISELLSHEYFAGIDWDLLLQKKITAPWKPKLTSALDVGYVDPEFTELDVNIEVASPSDKNTKPRGLSFIEKMGRVKSGKKQAPVTEDPAFKDFTYYCEDPDALVKVPNLVYELHDHPNGTPLACFVENGRLLYPSTPSRGVVNAAQHSQSQDEEQTQGVQLDVQSQEKEQGKQNFQQTQIGNSENIGVDSEDISKQCEALRL